MNRLGARRLFYDLSSGVQAETLRALLARVPAARAEGLDKLGVDAAWGLVDVRDRTCLRAVRVVPPGGGPREKIARAPLCDALVDAARVALRGVRRPVVALGGGIDAPLAVLAARRAGVTIDDAIHLSIPGTSYDESVCARETATALGLALHEVRVDADELAAELPRAVRLAETPLYNLHPVSRSIVARVALARGHDALVTGDGADQASRGATERADYVPVVAAITRGAGLTLASPFVVDALVEVLVAARDPGKKRLRALAGEWSLPAGITQRSKVPCSAPPLPRAAFPQASMLAPLSRAVGRSLAWSDDDRSNVRIATLAAFVAAFEISLDARGAA